MTSVNIAFTLSISWHLWVQVPKDFLKPSALP